MQVKTTIIEVESTVYQAKLQTPYPKKAIKTAMGPEIPMAQMLMTARALNFIFFISSPLCTLLNEAMKKVVDMNTTRGVSLG
jgi:hypothetical protein